MTNLAGAVWSMLDYRAIVVIKAGVAAAAAIVLIWELRHSTETSKERNRRITDSALGMLALVALLSWWNFGRFHFPDYLQVHEHFHYYLGSKYFPELGYTRLYDCAATADVEAGFARDVSQRWVRNLTTNVMEKGARIVRDPAGVCTSHFSSERWAEFKRDIEWFRAHRTPDLWRASQIDHGYNATPVWGVAGRLLSQTGPASTSRLTALSLLDPLLLAIMWAFVYWAFGWRAMCVAMIFWGTYYPARFIWTGGAFLRADWLALSTIGICLVKRGRMAAGGFALTYGALLRIFPGFIVVALGLQALVTMWRKRTFALEQSHRRFAAGCLVALALLVPASAVVVGGGLRGGIDAWQGFIANSEKHLSTPFTNNMGLKVLVSFDARSREAVVAPYWLDSPWDTWRAARQTVFERRQPVFWVLVALFVVLLTFAVQKSTDSVALIMGVALVPVALQLSCYYYAMLLIFGLLSRSTPWVGIALCALSAASGLVPGPLEFNDDMYAVLSLLAVGFVTMVTAHAAITQWRSRRMPADAS